MPALSVKPSTQLFRELESRLSSSFQEVIVSSFGSLKASLEAEIRSLHAKVGELTERIEQLEKDHSIPPLDMDSFQPSIEATINSTVTTLLAEEKEKEKRKLNLILHQIPESTSEAALERKAHDADHVKSIFENFLKIDTEIDTVGKKNPQKTRLLKVDVPSEKLKKLAL